MFLFFSNFPIQYAFSFLVQFYAEAYHLSLVSLERFQVSVFLNLLDGSLLAAIVSQLQFYHVDVAGSLGYEVDSSCSKHVLHFNLQSDGIQNGTDDESIALFCVGRTTS